MNNALLAGVAGLNAHQKMLDVAGNNLANVNTTAFKSSRVLFAELLSNTIRQASQPTATVGGTNPQQIGSGVMLSSVDRNMRQGSLINTGQSLDMGIEGAGYFVLSDGSKDVFTRVGTFAVDSGYYLVDPGTGFRLQRIGSEGEAEGFQDVASSTIRIPYDVALPANVTENLSYTGNLSADRVDPSTNLMTSGTQYTSGSAVATGSTVISAMDQASSNFAGTVRISGTNADGTTVSPVDLTVTNGVTTLSDVIDAINNGIGTEEQYQGQVADAVGSTGSNFVTATGADSNLSITFDGVTRTIGSQNLGTANVLTTGLDTGGTVTLNDLVTLINTAFNGQTGAVCGVMGDIASTVDLGGGNYVLQIEAAGETPHGAITDYSISASAGDIDFVTSAADVVTGRFTNTVDGSGNNGFVGATASMVNGEIRLLDSEAGYSQTDINLEVLTGATGSLELPKYFKYLAAGGELSKSTNVEVFDSLGIAHVFSAAFVRTDTTNKWDLVLTSITGDVDVTDRRISGITFMTDGSYGGLSGATPDSSSFQLQFGHETATRTIDVDLGTIGEFDGLSQFGGTSTAAPSGQDGYASGWLSSLSVSREGVLVGMFTNGIRRDLAAIRLATFQNPAGLESIGNNYFTTSSNSGDAVSTKGLAGGAGSVRGGSLERSNVDVAAEFVNMIQAQNGFQANARTIRVANDVLRELTNLIR